MTILLDADVDAARDARKGVELAAQILPSLTRAVSDLDDTHPSRVTTEAELYLMRQLEVDASGTPAQACSIRPAG
jgi:hypothetical protein